MDEKTRRELERLAQEYCGAYPDGDLLSYKAGFTAATEIERARSAELEAKLAAAVEALETLKFNRMHDSRVTRHCEEALEKIK